MSDGMSDYVVPYGAGFTKENKPPRKKRKRNKVPVHPPPSASPDRKEPKP